ncbi:MAG: glucosaminidase domain-containing protein, partial [Muribaculaceae bacterium]
MGKNADYAAQYAELAKDNMRRYGIPASVTLAQGILESANGGSELARLGNNHFGIKASASWLKGGGEFLVYTDDRPDEKFCKYASVAESYEHHSKILRNSSRYSDCFKLDADDYKGWCEGIAKAGYASGGNYAATLQRIIEVNHLDRFDKEVIAEKRSIGASENRSASSAQQQEASYSFPLRREEFLFVTSAFGNRKDPLDKSRTQMHRGIDIACRHDDVLATEGKGRVVAVNNNPDTAGGKSVTVEYSRPDGSKVRCSYLHLSEVFVRKDDVVKVGEKLGVTGNTGYRTTGEHLHFGVKSVSADGSTRDIDPALYLAEIAVKGNIALQAQCNGKDLLAKYKPELLAANNANQRQNDYTNNQEKPEVATASDAKQEQQAMKPDDWMRKLLSSEDSGVGISGSNDPIMDFIMQAFSMLMLLAVDIDRKSEDEQRERISEMAFSRNIDLKPFLPSMKQCSLSLDANNRFVLDADNGTVKV